MYGWLFEQWLTQTSDSSNNPSAEQLIIHSIPFKYVYGDVHVAVHIFLMSYGFCDGQLATQSPLRLYFTAVGHSSKQFFWYWNIVDAHDAVQLLYVI